MKSIQKKWTWDNLNILVIEDDPVSSLHISKLFKELGVADFIICSTGEEALQKVITAKPDIMLIDIILPGDLDGIDSAKSLKKIADIPFLYITANTNTEIIKRARSTEPFGYINKPISLQDLQSNIDAALYRSNLEKSLKEREEEYRNLFEFSNDGIIIIDMKSNIIKVNERFSSMVGYSVSELEGRNIKTIIDPIDLKDNPIEKRIDEVKNGAVLLFNRRLIHKNSERVHTEINSRLLPNGNIQGMVRDISERVDYSQELEKINSRLEEEVVKRTNQLQGVSEFNTHIISEAPAGIAVYDETGDCILANEALAAAIGGIQYKIMKQNFHELESWKGSGLYDMALDVIKTKKSQSKYIFTTSTFGKKVWLDCRMSTFCSQEKWHLLLILIDVSERITIEKELQHKNLFLEGINNVIIKAIKNVSEKEIATSYLKGALNLFKAECGFVYSLTDSGSFKLTSEVSIDENNSESVCDEEEENDTSVGGLIHRLMESKKSILNNNVSSKDLQGFPRGCSNINSFLGVPLVHAGKLIGFLGLCNKNSDFKEDDLKEAEQLSNLFIESTIRKKMGEKILELNDDIIKRTVELESAKRVEKEMKTSLFEKELLLKEIHHRVKNNLQVITSLINLQSIQIDDKEITAALNDIQARIKSMSLVHEVLYQSKDFARVNFSEYINLIMHNLSLFYGLDEASVTMHSHVKEVSISIDYAIPCGLILNELIANSMKHAFPEGEKGEIHVNMERNKKGYSLKVRDNGVGIPLDLSGGTSDTLGMKLIHVLAKQIKGSVSINSENGTEVGIEIPFR